MRGVNASNPSFAVWVYDTMAVGVLWDVERAFISNPVPILPSALYSLQLRQVGAIVTDLLPTFG